MKDLHEIKERIKDEVRAMAHKRGEMSMGELEQLHKLIDTWKDIDKIYVLEADDESGYSGRHYVRGHYSRDDGHHDDGYSRGRRYPRDDGRDAMMSHLTAAMATSDEGDREMIRSLIERMR